MPVKDYSELLVWQKAMDWVMAIYHCTDKFPKEELFALTRQLRESSVSVPSNISEGFGQLTTANYIRHLGIARGSLYEAQTQTQVAGRLHYLNDEELRELIEMSSRIGRLLNSLIRSLRTLRKKRMTSRKNHDLSAPADH